GPARRAAGRVREPGRGRPLRAARPRLRRGDVGVAEGPAAAAGRAAGAVAAPARGPADADRGGAAEAADDGRHAMSKNVAGDADARRNAAREAHRAGESPSAAGVTTGASKQI